MYAPLTQARDQVHSLCEKHHVRQLEVFGSAASDSEGAPRDLDFVVEFEALTPVDHASAYFGLLADLRDLFRRSVDLVESSAIRNPYFVESVNQTRTVIYAT